MTKENGELKEKLARKASSPARSNRPEETIRQYLERMGPEIRRALPKHLDPDRLARVALTTIRTNPKLLECNIGSLMAAVMQAAQLGLEPGILGHCYIIPYGKEAQFIIGYRGFIDLARRSGNIQSIASHEVCEGDEFQFEYGLDEKLCHKPALKDRGEPYLYYAYAKFKGGGHSIEVMSIEEIERIRGRSKAKDSGPWITDYDEMAKKTVVRRLAKYLPISIEIMRGLEQDESVKTEITEDISEVIDIPAEDVSKE